MSKYSLQKYKIRPPKNNGQRLFLRKKDLKTVEEKYKIKTELHYK